MNVRKILGLLLFAMCWMLIGDVKAEMSIDGIIHIENLVKENNLRVLSIENLSVNDMSVDRNNNIYLAGEGAAFQQVIVGVSGTNEVLWIDVAEDSVKIREIENLGNNTLLIAEYKGEGDTRRINLEKWNLEGSYINKEYFWETKGQLLGLWSLQNSIFVFKYDEIKKSYLSKISMIGDVEWELLYNEPIVYIKDIISEHDGDVLIGYTMNDHSADSSSFIEKIDAKGLTKWRVELEAGTKMVAAARYSTGSIVIVGSKLIDNRSEGYMVEIKDGDVIRERTFEDLRIRGFAGIITKDDQIICSCINKKDKARIELIYMKSIDDEHRIRTFDTTYDLIETGYMLKAGECVTVGVNGRRW